MKAYPKFTVGDVLDALEGVSRELPVEFTDWELDTIPVGAVAVCDNVVLFRDCHDCEQIEVADTDDDCELSRKRDKLRRIPPPVHWRDEKSKPMEYIPSRRRNLVVPSRSAEGWRGYWNIMGSSVAVCRNPRFEVSKCGVISECWDEAPEVLSWSRPWDKRIVCNAPCCLWETCDNEDMYPGAWFNKPLDHDALIAYLGKHIDRPESLEFWRNIILAMKADPTLWFVWEL